MVRLVAVSQPGAGRFLDAVPSRADFRVPTWALRIAVQRRLGLPLLAAAAAAGERFSRHGKLFDAYGDVAVNDGAAGHSTRHYLILKALHDAFKRAWGGQVRREPQDYHDYSDHRPDLTILLDQLWAFDLKVFDPVGSEPGEVCGRGAFVAMGNTRPEARAVVHGVEERGVAGTAFDPRTGTGHVARREGDYARARAAGVAVEVLLVETFGGLGDGLMNVLEEAQRVREDMLSASEYDETTWSARTWMVFVQQRISVATQRAVSHEIATALGLGLATDPRGHDGA